MLTNNSFMDKKETIVVIFLESLLKKQEVMKDKDNCYGIQTYN